MAKGNKKESFFWTSYSDLMTSLFFVMLLLFVLTIISLRNTLIKVEGEKIATEQQIDKIREIEDAVHSIDPEWFRYDSVHKKHILNIDVAFHKGSADITDIPQSTLTRLLKAGASIHNFLEKANKNNVKYLLIIEGQASRDNYPLNDELSYRRALALSKFWERNNLDFSSSGCEVIVSGSGQTGTLRVPPDNATNPANQRFLIHVVPKPGIIEASKHTYTTIK
ncbi:MAG: OmpA family protein [Prevotellaceae bacterium]|jgi:hypothetical protein|nr:OmpA family protein [Prevotellaceae bacterium]